MNRRKNKGGAQPGNTNRLGYRKPEVDDYTEYGDLNMAVFPNKSILLTLSKEGASRVKVGTEIAGPLLARLTNKAHELGSTVYLCRVICMFEPNTGKETEDVIQS